MILWNSASPRIQHAPDDGLHQRGVAPDGGQGQNEGQVQRQQGEGEPLHAHAERLVREPVAAEDDIEEDEDADAVLCCWGGGGGWLGWNDEVGWPSRSMDRLIALFDTEQKPATRTHREDDEGEPALAAVHEPGGGSGKEDDGRVRGEVSELARGLRFLWIVVAVDCGVEWMSQGIWVVRQTVGGSIDPPGRWREVGRTLGRDGGIDIHNIWRGGLADSQ